ncbi:S-adenosyl-L-methionine-dependent tRNA 4-demethylwyosine synthase TYW1-like [Condylostylus longicornis]|uniref:S-adenosyl-L-methionine-dependent tRNA 4-demethylwyosine synthase TYW1-like n=1 Tax=Condylostylus longicornis TaxID=2530218 RepID=UPI00244E3A8A|nr:S-adenosyl-L-methionine-dependent tRNA 4-demethylwyosine synthase TYW1-like [Condylostylus longicornis]
MNLSTRRQSVFSRESLRRFTTFAKVREYRPEEAFPDLPDAAENEVDDGNKCGQEGKSMMTPRLSASLTKAGYGLVGNHSAVKVCRWTKKQLQGRGGCYKHTFYGIESHRCMETTTFLACANRCVFCWRHHTHPVAKDFTRWKPDPPDMLIEKAIETHRLMIKPLKGLVGATKERYEEAMNPRHCALSLVGEPIVYPYINEFVQMLHDRSISSFIVTNGQHPESIDGLVTPVTQLYISVDAPDPVTLKLIGRPLFKDYWDRLRQSLMNLSQRTERTVARLTVVKRWNDKDVEGYAELVRLGNPDFVEIKAFTYPGPTPSIKEANLTINNCPTGQDILTFGQKLIDALKGNSGSGNDQKQWEIASLHLHSNSVLLASNEFQLTPDEPSDDGTRWKTWINYDTFHALIRDNAPELGHRDPMGLFSSRLASLYRRHSPSWASVDSPLGGFDPQFDTKGWIAQLANRRVHEQHDEHLDEQ